MKTIVATLTYIVGDERDPNQTLEEQTDQIKEALLDCLAQENDDFIKEAVVVTEEED